MSAARRSRLRKYTSDLLFEFVVVLMGVLVALLLEDAWQARKERLFVADILADIRTEHSNNYAELDSIRNRHQVLFETLDTRLDSSQYTILDIIQLGTNGLQGTSVRSPSWSAAQNTNLQVLDFEFVKSLSNVQYAADHLDEQFKRLSDYIYIANSDTSRKAKEKFHLYLYDLIFAEDNTLAALEAFLAVSATPSEP